MSPFSDGHASHANTGGMNDTSISGGAFASADFTSRTMGIVVNPV
jgi:hypothetical protein